MSEALQIDNLCNLPTVGPATAQDILDAGYETFADLSAARPMNLHTQCDIVISSTALIIDAAVEEMDGTCPKCTAEDIAPIFRAWTKTLDGGSDSDGHVVCDSCGWHGSVGELNGIPFKPDRDETDVDNGPRLTAD